MVNVAYKWHRYLFKRSEQRGRLIFQAKLQVEHQGLTESIHSVVLENKRAVFRLSLVLDPSVVHLACNTSQEAGLVLFQVSGFEETFDAIKEWCECSLFQHGLSASHRTNKTVHPPTYLLHVLSSIPHNSREGLVDKSVGCQEITILTIQMDQGHGDMFKASFCFLA